MTTRRSFALKLGGRFLVNTIMRRYPNRYRMQRETREQVQDQRLAELEEAWLGVDLPTWMSAPFEELGDAELAFIRTRFYADCNMTTPMLHRWTYDPRVLDGLNAWRKGVEARRARTRLRQLAFIRASALPDGNGWSKSSYDVARQCVFVVESCFHPLWVDYETWVVLRNFGRDWAKPTRYQPQRRLPSSVALQATLALARHKITGAPRGASQL